MLLRPTRFPARLISPSKLSNNTHEARGHAFRWRARALLSLLVFSVILLGPNGLLSVLPVAHAQAPQNISNDQPNRFNPRRLASPRPTPRTPGPHGSSGNPPPAQFLTRHEPSSMQPGSLTLTPGHAAQFLGSDGLLEVDVPANAVTAADVSQAGNTLTLQITQIAPASGSTAGGSGLISFGTYLLQVVDVQGKRAAHGLRAPITLKLHYGFRGSAVDLTHAFVVFNAALPHGVQLAASSTGAASVLDPAAAHAATLDTQQHTLSATLSPGVLASSASFNTNSPVASFGKPDPFNVDLNAGALSFAEPIDLPPGPGGFTPPVSLAYSSEGVSEQHNVQAAAPWVGEGWNLSLGSISWQSIMSRWAALLGAAPTGRIVGSSPILLAQRQS